MERVWDLLTGLSTIGDGSYSYCSCSSSRHPTLTMRTDRHEPKMQILTFQDSATWDVSPDTGFIEFASSEDAKKAEALFNAIQAEAKAVVRDAERYRWIREHGAWDTESFLNSLTPEEYDAELDKRMVLDGHS